VQTGSTTTDVSTFGNEDTNMTLTGITKKGRERVKRDGSEGWTVLRTTDWVAWSSDTGPWILVLPASGNHSRSRWIHGKRDPDFNVER